MKLIRNKQLVYELVMVLLAALSVATIWYSTSYSSYIVWITWGIFFSDFAYRLYKTDNRWQFIRGNPFLIIALIPLDAIFQLARFARILHLLRLKTITKYYTMPFIHFLKRQHLLVVVAFAFIVIFLTIIPLYHVEPGLESYQQAFISSLMSLVFFGKTTFDPMTTIGHIIIVFLTIIGVIFHGLVISTAMDFIYQSKGYQFFLQKIKRNKESK